MMNQQCFIALEALSLNVISILLFEFVPYIVMWYCELGFHLQVPILWTGLEEAGIAEGGGVACNGIKQSYPAFAE